MSRSIPWRRVCPDSVKSRIEAALEARFYILRETGPTGFLVKEENQDTKLKVIVILEFLDTIIFNLRDKPYRPILTFMKSSKVHLNLVCFLINLRSFSL